MLNNFVFEGDNTWSDGTIYDPREGKTYSCKLTLKSPDQLNVRGYVGVALFGRTEIWTRFATEKKMTQLLDILRLRNEPLFFFGLICFGLADLFLILTRLSNGQVMGINAWVKPFKFAVSLAIYAWTMAWFCHELAPSFNVKPFNWTVILMLGFELAYIA